MKKEHLCVWGFVFLFLFLFFLRSNSPHPLFFIQEQQESAAAGYAASAMLSSPILPPSTPASVWSPGMSSLSSSQESQGDKLPRQRAALNSFLVESGYSPVKKSLTVCWAPASSKTQKDYLRKANQVNLAFIIITLYYQYGTRPQHASRLFELSVLSTITH